MIRTFKKLIMVLAVVGSAPMLQAQSATTWNVDKAHTSVNFSVNHFFSAVTGKFDNFEGQISFDPENLGISSVSFTIPVSSINTSDAKRDKHLQSDDFFNVKKFPIITFKSSKFEKKSGNDYIVHGQLTIRDVTKNVALPFKVLGQMEHPMMKNTMLMGISLDTKINRTDYGVGVGSWAATAVVGDEVTIDINMELNRKK
ncbi:YceI family protein [Dyadobacter tibetensis]|uniref:YceI family protein n=1 Tax=Dyadobacter tibetensis TaxID=1211851 RepID=UPI000A07362A|nr:YceI family protein [Dyadobacter tibetensis]